MVAEKADARVIALARVRPRSSVGANARVATTGRAGICVR